MSKYSSRPGPTPKHTDEEFIEAYKKVDGELQKLVEYLDLPYQNVYYRIRRLKKYYHAADLRDISLDPFMVYEDLPE